MRLTVVPCAFGRRRPQAFSAQIDFIDLPGIACAVAGRLKAPHIPAWARGAAEEFKFRHTGIKPFDLLGEEAVAKTTEALGVEAPSGEALTASTFVADLASNAGYYAMIGKGDNDTILLRGAGYGLMAGLGAIGLAKPLGLNESSVARTDETKLLTVAWYLLGGLAAALAIKSLR